ncbi:hypothetical protein GCM10010232_66220 [Streptomyces amakusaensis]|uniref:Uncharacterized protein n=1 Tax=Streptomyces amakusaensis TaxID=67271 RepID=A0ABW0ATC6_9ACTN
MKEGCRPDKIHSLSRVTHHKHCHHSNAIDLTLAATILIVL